MREVAGVHRELFAESAHLYGEDVRIKVEKCLAVRDADVERGERLRRRVPGAGRRGARRASISC